jgi:hypothetical protein
MTDCAFTDCRLPMDARGLCNGHYKQLRRGAPLSPLGPYRPSATRPDSKPGKRLTHLEREGIMEADADARRVRALTGLDMMPHGKLLAEHVENRLTNTSLPAVEIASQVGYRLERCAERLAEAGHAPLARALLARHAADLTRPRPTIVADEPKPAPEPGPVRGSEPKQPRRVAPTAEDILRELADAAQRGRSFDSVAEGFGMLAESLRRRIYRLKIHPDATAIFPHLGLGQPLQQRADFRTGEPTGRFCRQGHPLFATPLTRKPRCRECNRRYKATYNQWKTKGLAA